MSSERRGDSTFASVVHVDDKGKMIGELQPPLAFHGPCGVIGIQIGSCENKGISKAIKT